MSRRRIAAGNWKMNTNIFEGESLIKTIDLSKLNHSVEVIYGVPATHINSIAHLHTKNPFEVAAQNMYYEEKGAYTGEISANMIKEAGAKYVIIGHSERREIFGETDAVLLRKVRQALKNELLPIFCCGEPLRIRKENSHQEYVKVQFENVLFALSSEEMKQIIIAYEPIWAIGTGETASPEQAQEMHQYLRSLLNEHFGQEISDNTPILYGGSVNESNAESLFSQLDVDGGLVGGASLKASSFVKIINSFK